MGKNAEKPKSLNLAERGSRFLRDINLLGAAALTGTAVIVPEFSVPLLGLAAIDVAQAAFFHFTKDWAAHRRQKLQPKPA